MAEIFGAVAAGITVCHELSRLANVILKAVKTVQTARKDIADLLDETIIFTSLYGEFLQACEKDPKIYRDTASSIGRLKSWAEHTIQGFQKLLLKVDALRLDKNYRYSFIQTLRAQAEWLFSTSTVKLLQASLSVARQSMNGFSNLMCLEKLKEEIDMLRNTLNHPSQRRKIERKLGMKLEDKIQSLKKLMDVKKLTHFSNTRLLEKAVVEMGHLQVRGSASKTTAAATELLGVAEALDLYAENVLPPKALSRQNSSSASSESLSPSRGASGPSGAIQSNSSSSSISNAPIRSHLNPPSPASSFVRNFVAPNQPFFGKYQARPVMIHVRSEETVQTLGNNTYGRAKVSNQFRPVDRSNEVSQSPIHSNDCLQRVEKIGRHALSLSTQQFRINSHLWQVCDFAAANLFFDDILKHKYRLDELDEALNEQSPQSEWFGIPGWNVRLNGIRVEAEGLGARDV